MDRNKRRGGAERLKSSLFQPSELHQGQSIRTEVKPLRFYRCSLQVLLESLQKFYNTENTKHRVQLKSHFYGFRLGLHNISKIYHDCNINMHSIHIADIYRQCIHLCKGEKCSDRLWHHSSVPVVALCIDNKCSNRSDASVKVAFFFKVYFEVCIALMGLITTLQLNVALLHQLTTMRRHRRDPVLLFLFNSTVHTRNILLQCHHLLEWHTC